MTDTPQGVFQLMPTKILKNEATYNRNIVFVEALTISAALSRTVNDPSGLSPVPANGDVYIVPDAASSPAPAGDFSGQGDNIAVYYNGWKFITPVDGMTIYVVDETARVQWRTSAWVALPDNAITVRQYADTDYDQNVTTLDFTGFGSDIEVAGSVATITIPGGPPVVQSNAENDPSSLTPTDGQMWLIPDGSPAPVGDWAGRENQLAKWSDDGASPGEWKFYTPTGGETVVLAANASLLAYNVSVSPAAWSSSGGGVTDGDKGDITISGSGTVYTIDPNVVTFAKMQDIATERMIGRNTAGSGDPEEIARVSSAERTAGTETALRAFAPTDIANMAGTHGGSGGGTLQSLSNVDLGDSPGAMFGDYLMFDPSGSPDVWKHGWALKEVVLTKTSGQSLTGSFTEDTITWQTIAGDSDVADDIAIVSNTDITIPVSMDAKRCRVTVGIDSNLAGDTTIQLRIKLNGTTIAENQMEGNRTSCAAQVFSSWFEVNTSDVITVTARAEGASTTGSGAAPNTTFCCMEFKNAY